MDEKRRFFRLKNNGEIHAKAANASLDVIDISSTGILVIKKNDNIPKKGIIELSIHSFSTDLSYQILRAEEQTMVLIFNDEEEINKLFLVLKNLRNEQKKRHS